ncbi:bifunctional 2-keto-4-hydroxyglutarate aldolase/2-keto-3-deoxy-6-phosphogluconate aldolase [Jeotgalibaca sp. MA1X17-3]|uniref:bifunctional 2-keto-4-hydroxyglutarate aldolase/2-keto-3-deoxy-6-phosphogluconate aldolase n=1 Tax=Jeotgalibaca sp. MA1X17-3 TaxID=2908211 RepID=UPI001F32F02B|nr:bifunctional 2-keto-4-hydroxyglutarate aldolase/2-keto-3-deoxy-6-phosphogluconate aldolase [Jeotgalibaca sp. MA1X17-3]UJF16172.1 bifunctional 2-keto-4-hydroxyglutarate aldolase/2-keto-3-deoxy-6-phosphogluconate aldolase [Jeotgalibaca sp. MA1X17-3]
MSFKRDVLNQLQENFLFAVVRGSSQEEGYEISKAAYKGGIKNIEVTFSTPNAEKVMRQLADEFADSDMVVGAGTVLDEVAARIAILNGAKFIVSPSFNEKIAKMCNVYTIPYLPGCGTITEVHMALESGCEVVKLFPGGLLGPSFIKDLHGPIPWVEAMPSGGVSLDNMETWIGNGAWAVGVGSALTKNMKDDGYDSVTSAAKEFADKLAGIKAK